MSTVSKRARAEDHLAEDRRLEPILREAHARLRLWETCDKEGCRRGEICGGNVDQCAARAAPTDWAWLRHVVRIMLAGKSQKAAVEIANFAALGYRQRRIIRWPGVPCWDPVEDVQLQDGSWKLSDLVPRRPDLDPQFERLAVSPWLRAAVDADATARREGLEAVCDVESSARQTRSAPLPRREATWGGGAPRAARVAGTPVGGGGASKRGAAKEPHP